jgi:hypothetical protein
VKASAQILRTCKQLYHEALSVLYGENLFKAPCLVSVKKFSISIGERAATCVQHLSIDFCPRAINMNVDNYQHTYETFAGMSNLKTLEITMCNQLNAQAKVPSALISGSMVPRQSLLLPKRMPNLPRVVVDLFLANDGLEVRFDVLIQFGSDLQYSFFVSVCPFCIHDCSGFR